MNTKTYYVLELDPNTSQDLLKLLEDNKIIRKNKLFNSTKNDVVICCDENFINVIDKMYDIKVYRYSDLRSKL